MLPRPIARVLALASASFILTTAVQADVFYVTDSAADVVRRINQAGIASALPTTAGDLSDPQQVVFDAAGNAYVADNALGKVQMYAPGSASAVQVGDDVPGVIALAFSPNGVLHAVSATDDTIRKLSSDGTTFQTISTLPVAATARSIAFRKNGDIFVADNAGSKIFTVGSEGGTPSEYSDAVTAPFALAVDAADKLFVSDTRDNGRIASFRGNGNNTDTLIGDLGDVRGFAFDQANVAYYLTGAGELRRVTGADTTELVAGSLGVVNLLTARTAGVTAIAHKDLVVPAAGNAKIGTVGSPSIGNGQVAFKSVLATSATLPIVNASNALALFRSHPGGDLELLARKSFPAPGMTVGNVSPILNVFADPIMNNTGKVAFAGTLRAGVGGVTSADTIAIFSDYDGGTLRPVLRRNQADLGNGLDPAVKFTGFKQLVLPDDAGPAVLATIAGPGVTSSTNLGLWSLDLAGNLSLVLRNGAEITAGGKLRKLAGLKLFNPTVLSLGQARHFGDNQTFTLLAKFSDGFTAILRVQAGVPTPEVLVEKGAEVGTAIPSAKLGTLGNPAMADDGFLAFRAVLQPLANVVTAATAPVILSRDTALAKDARAGEPAPDVTNGVFATLSDPVVSSNGAIAFLGKLRPVAGSITSANATALWQDLGTGLHPAARQGDKPPGVPGTTRFTAFKQFVLPSTGGVVFTAAIAGDAITSANNLGVWTNDGAGATELLLRKGSKLLIGGKTRTVTAFKIFTTALGVTGQSRHFDDSGTLACHVTCSDGAQAVLAIQRP